MTQSINIPFSFAEIGPVLEVSEFLTENQDELIKDFKPTVAPMLANRDKFRGFLGRSFNQAFEDLVASLIADKIINHFNFTPEQNVILTEPQFLLMISGDLFDQEQYLKE